jgi:hypothetical protein
VGTPGTKPLEGTSLQGIEGEGMVGRHHSSFCKRLNQLELVQVSGYLILIHTVTSLLREGTLFLTYKNSYRGIEGKEEPMILTDILSYQALVGKMALPSHSQGKAYQLLLQHFETLRV